MSEIWESYPLAALVTKVGSGSTPKGGSEAYKAVGTPLIRSMNVVFFGFKKAGLAYIDKAQAAQLDNATVKAGDVLLNITGASIGRVTLAPAEFEGARVNQHVCIIRPSEALDARFLNAYLSSPVIQNQIWSDNFGVTRQALTKQQILDFQVPVPPKAEQTRIANHLDTLLTRIQSCNDRFDAIPALLKRFRQAVLGAATSGALTQEWRLDAKSSWRDVKLAEVAHTFSYGSAAKSSKTGTVPVLRMGNIQEGQIDWSDLVYTSDPLEIERYKLSKGDVLFNRTNSPELVGKTAVYQGERPAIYAGYLIRVRCSNELLPEYLNYCLGSRMGRDYCWSVKTDGVSQSNINAKKLAAFPFKLPSVTEQAEIIRRVEVLFALVDSIEARATAARTRAQRLSALVLAKAFRGELVPQDPQDEPPSVLLERIATQRNRTAAKKPSKASRQTSASRAPKEAAAVTKSRQDEDVKGKPYLADHLRRLGAPTAAEVLFKASELPIADFYKQLAWEVAQGHIADGGTTLEARNAAG